MTPLPKHVAAPNMHALLDAPSIGGDEEEEEGSTADSAADPKGSQAADDGDDDEGPLPIPRATKRNHDEGAAGAGSCGAVSEEAVKWSRHHHSCHRGAGSQGRPPGFGAGLCPRYCCSEGQEMPRRQGPSSGQQVRCLDFTSCL